MGLAPGLPFVIGQTCQNGCKLALDISKITEGHLAMLAHNFDWSG